jgi:hypothetical protein
LRKPDKIQAVARRALAWYREEFETLRHFGELLGELERELFELTQTSGAVGAI